MTRRKIGELVFADVYPLYAAKVERKGRTKEELNEVIRWLTGFDEDSIAKQIASRSDFASFFAEAPRIHHNAAAIKGLICGVRVEEIADPVEQKVRWLDKLVDELAKGKAMDKILR